MDLGLIAVSADEAGVFRSFNAIETTHRDQGGPNAKVQDVNGIDTRTRYNSSRNPENEAAGGLVDPLALRGGVRTHVTGQRARHGEPCPDVAVGEAVGRISESSGGSAYGRKPG